MNRCIDAILRFLQRDRRYPFEKQMELERLREECATLEQEKELLAADNELYADAVIDLNAQITQLTAENADLSEALQDARTEVERWKNQTVDMEAAPVVPKPARKRQQKVASDG